MKPGQIFKKYFCFLLGMGILAFGLYNIHSRSEISEGGLLGTILLLNHWFHISPSISGFVIDTVTFIIATFILGRQFLKDSIIATILFSLWYMLFEYMGPVIPSLIEHPLIAAVSGAAFVGIGTGLIVIYGTACGADDALVLVFNKLFHIPVAVTYFVSDFTILMLSLTYIPFRRIAFSLLSVLISSMIIEIMTRFIKPELKAKKENAE